MMSIAYLKQFVLLQMRDDSAPRNRFRDMCGRPSAFHTVGSTKKERAKARPSRKEFSDLQKERALSDRAYEDIQLVGSASPTGG
jgi:hypothetical protein